MSLNRCLLVLVLLVLASISACTEPSEPTLSSGDSSSALMDLSQRSASEMVPLLKSGEISVEDYIKHLLLKGKAVSSDLNAFISLPAEQILKAAQAADAKRQAGEQLGPLFGVPVSLKDLVVTKDMTTTFGTKKFAGFKGKRNAPLVDRLIQAGAIIYGKNNAQEWAFGSTGYNSHYGQQLNPYDKNRIAGGSSGGGAAAVAARLLPIAIGSDTAASIRVPAAYTGLYGLRPTIGRYDNSGVAPLAPTLDTVGPMTRSIDDMVLIDEVLSGDDSTLPIIDLKGLRLGIPTKFFHSGLSDEMRDKFNALCGRLEAAGVVLVRVNLPEAQKLTDEGLYPILFYETYPSIVQFLAEWGDGTTIDELHANLGSDIKAMWDQLVMPNAPESVPHDVYNNAINEVRPTMQKTYQEYFSQHEVYAILFPATASAAPLAKPDNPQETMINGELVSIFINDHNSSPGALAGQPGVVIPLAMNKHGLPMGVSLDGIQGDDRRLLALAKSISYLIEPLPAPQILRY